MYQKEIFNEQSSHHYFLEYALSAAVSIDDVKHQISNLINHPFTPSLVIAFGFQSTKRLGFKTPKTFRDFQEIQGVKHFKSPATQQDIFFWVHSQNHDENYNLATKIHTLMKPVADLKVDVHGFKYLDSRDFTGFIDGSANPKEENARSAALIPQGSLGEYGSIVLTQKWLHNMESFNLLPQHVQEKIIGRTKPDSIEFVGDEMPPDSHVSRTDAKVNGVVQKIYRRSAPFGNMDEKGLYFLAFSCEIERFQIQLNRMFGLTNDGLYDKLIEYSTPVTGSYWFAPSETELKKIFHN